MTHCFGMAADSASINWLEPFLLRLQLCHHADTEQDISVIFLKSALSAPFAFWTTELQLIIPRTRESIAKCIEIDPY